MSETKSMGAPEPLYGIIAEFDGSEDVLRALRALIKEDYRKLDTFSPYAVEGAAELLGRRSRSVNIIAAASAVCGACLGYGMEYYAAAVGYPLNVGGRPYNGVPSFLQVTFEMFVLAAAFASIACVAISGRLGTLHHPIFEARHFTRVSRDGFFVFVSSEDPKFERAKTMQFLASLNPLEISEVERC